MKNEVINALMAELDSLNKDIERYTSAFPQELRLGLTSFRECDNDFKINFLAFSSRLTASLERTDALALNISSLLISADTQMNEALVLLYDDILKKYENYKKNVCDFLDSNHKLLSKRDDSVSLSRLYALLSSFISSTDLFYRYLASL